MNMQAISESTKVRLSLLIAILGAVITATSGGIWFAATLNGKVNILIEGSNNSEDVQKEQAQHILALEKFDTKFEVQFSVLQSRVLALEAKVGNAPVNGNGNQR